MYKNWCYAHSRQIRHVRYIMGVHRLLALTLVVLVNVIGAERLSVKLHDFMKSQPAKQTG